MKKWLKYIGVALLVIGELALIGCAMAPDLVIPCWIEPEAAEYADVNIPGLLPYTTLHDARQVARGMNFKHLTSQTAILRDLDDENLRYNYLNNAHSLYMRQSEQLKENVFSPTGPIGILLSGGILGTMGIVLVDRPGTRQKLAEAKEQGKKEANGG